MSSAEIVGKVAKHMDVLKVRCNKLAEENAKLKEQIAASKKLNSRVRRIPKKPAATTGDGVIAGENEGDAEVAPHADKK
jgi:hypothetical protein